MKIQIEGADLRSVLNALEELNSEKSYWWQEVERDTVKALENAESICKQALAYHTEQHLEMATEQPAQQEPVAYAVYHRMGGSKTLHWPEQHSEDGDHNEYQLVPLYTSPPIEATPLASQSRSDVKPWVGLTELEALGAYEAEQQGRWGDHVRGLLAVEAKLWEKNT